MLRVNCSNCTGEKPGTSARLGLQCSSIYYRDGTSVLGAESGVTGETANGGLSVGMRLAVAGDTGLLCAATDQNT